jgi:DNA-binding Xre family transcriptional regulator
MFKRLELSDLDEIIKSHSLTKKEISLRVGMTQNGLHEALNERQSLKLTTFQDICQVMDVHPSSLFLTSGQNLLLADEGFEVNDGVIPYKKIGSKSSQQPETEEKVSALLYKEMKARYEDEIRYLRGLVDALKK